MYVSTDSEISKGGGSTLAQLFIVLYISLSVGRLLFVFLGSFRLHMRMSAFWIRGYSGMQVLLRTEGRSILSMTRKGYSLSNSGHGKLRKMLGTQCSTSKFWDEGVDVLLCSFDGC